MDYLYLYPGLNIMETFIHLYLYQPVVWSKTMAYPPGSLGFKYLKDLSWDARLVVLEQEPFHPHNLFFLLSRDELIQIGVLNRSLPVGLNLDLEYAVDKELELYKKPGTPLSAELSRRTYLEFSLYSLGTVSSSDPLLRYSYETEREKAYKQPWTSSNSILESSRKTGGATNYFAQLNVCYNMELESHLSMLEDPRWLSMFFGTTVHETTMHLQHQLVTSKSIYHRIQSLKEYVWSHYRFLIQLCLQLVEPIHVHARSLQTVSSCEMTCPHGHFMASMLLVREAGQKLRGVTLLSGPEQLLSTLVHVILKPLIIHNIPILWLDPSTNVQDIQLEPVNSNGVLQHISLDRTRASEILEKENQWNMMRGLIDPLGLDNWMIVHIKSVIMGHRLYNHFSPTMSAWKRQFGESLLALNFHSSSEKNLLFTVSDYVLPHNTRSTTTVDLNGVQHFVNPSIETVLYPQEPKTVEFFPESNWSNVSKCTTKVEKPRETNFEKYKTYWNQAIAQPHPTGFIQQIGSLMGSKLNWAILSLSTFQFIILLGMKTTLRRPDYKLIQNGDDLFLILVSTYILKLAVVMELSLELGYQINRYKQIISPKGGLYCEYLFLLEPDGYHARTAFKAKYLHTRPLTKGDTEVSHWELALEALHSEFERLRLLPNSLSVLIATHFYLRKYPAMIRSPLRTYPREIGGFGLTNTQESIPISYPYLPNMFEVGKITNINHPDLEPLNLGITKLAISLSKFGTLRQTTSPEYTRKISKQLASQLIYGLIYMEPYPGQLFEHLDTRRGATHTWNTGPGILEDEVEYTDDSPPKSTHYRKIPKSITTIPCLNLHEPSCPNGKRGSDPSRFVYMSRWSFPYTAYITTGNLPPPNSWSRVREPSISYDYNNYDQLSHDYRLADYKEEVSLTLSYLPFPIPKRGPDGFSDVAQDTSLVFLNRFPYIWFPSTSPSRLGTGDTRSFYSLRDTPWTGKLDSNNPQHLNYINEVSEELQNRRSIRLLSSRTLNDEFFRQLGQQGWNDEELEYSLPKYKKPHKYTPAPPQPLLTARQSHELSILDVPRFPDLSPPQGGEPPPNKACPYCTDRGLINYYVGTNFPSCQHGTLLLHPIDKSPTCRRKLVEDQEKGVYLGNRNYILQIDELIHRHRLLLEYTLETHRIYTSPYYVRELLKLYNDTTETTETWESIDLHYKNLYLTAVRNYVKLKRRHYNTSSPYHKMLYAKNLYENRLVTYSSLKTRLETRPHWRRYQYDPIHLEPQPYAHLWHLPHVIAGNFYTHANGNKLKSEYDIHPDFNNIPFYRADPMEGGQPLSHWLEALTTLLESIMLFIIPSPPRLQQRTGRSIGQYTDAWNRIADNLHTNLALRWTKLKPEDCLSQLNKLKSTMCVRPVPYWLPELTIGPPSPYDNNAYRLRPETQKLIPSNQLCECTKHPLHPLFSVIDTNGHVIDRVCYYKLVLYSPHLMERGRDHLDELHTLLSDLF